MKIITHTIMLPIPHSGDPKYNKAVLNRLQESGEFSFEIVPYGSKEC